MPFPAVVRAFVFNPDGKVLMAQHKAGTPWVLPGGHVEPGESIHSAMIRELQEEFSLDARFFDMDHEEMLHHRGKKLAHYPLPISIYDLSYTSKDGKDNSRTEYVFLMESDSQV
jgi:8-oxo-dGTP pyrophosphatase MutT (NUDIX family)